MRRTLLAALVCIGVSARAEAGDEKGGGPEQALRWGGFSIGADATYDWDHTGGNTYRTTTGDYVTSFLAKSNGTFCGIHAAYDYAWSSGLVTGLGASEAGGTASGSQVLLSPDGTQVAATLSVTTHSVGALCPRIGYAGGRYMAYVMAGLGWRTASSLRTQYATTLPKGYAPAFSTVPVQAMHASSAGAGLALGGGLCVALDSRWSLDLRYAYLDWRHRSMDNPQAPASVYGYGQIPADPRTSRVRSQDAALSLGIDYRLF